MLLQFTLSMPNKGSWNGRWTGEDRLYAKVISFRSKEKLQTAKEILGIGNFYYNFGDGWSAKINVQPITTKEAVKVRRNTKGFCGYDWMIDSIINNRKIMKP